MRRRPRTAPGLALLCLAALLAAAAGLPSSAPPPPEPGSGSGGPAEGSPGTAPPARPRGTAAPARGSAPPPPPPPEEEEEEEVAVAEEEEEGEEEEATATAGSGPAGERPTRVRDGGRRGLSAAGPPAVAGSGTGLPPPSLRRADKGAVGDGAAVPQAPPAAATPVQGRRRDPRRVGHPGAPRSAAPCAPCGAGMGRGGCDPHAGLGWAVRGCRRGAGGAAAPNLSRAGGVTGVFGEQRGVCWAWFPKASFTAAIPGVHPLRS